MAPKQMKIRLRTSSGQGMTAQDVEHLGAVKEEGYTSITEVITETKIISN